MKKFALAAALTAAASTAFAGNLSQPVMENNVIEATTKSSSSGGILIPLVILAVIAAAVAD